MYRTNPQYSIPSYAAPKRSSGFLSHSRLSTESPTTASSLWSRKVDLKAANSYVFREWNTFSRVVVNETHVGRPQMWGPSKKLTSENVVVEQRAMNIDGDAGTTAIRFTGRIEDVDFLKYDVTNLAYFLPERKRAAVIGVGGGRDIVSAATFGYREITGVELNPVFVKLLTREPGFFDFTNLAKLSGVSLVVDEGRSWFARTDQRFDLIQMSLIDTWAATGAGAFSLSENGLYTVEAWKIFLGRLTERGVFTVSRWYNPNDPSETARMLSLAVAALLERGVTEPQRHIVLATQGRIATLVLSREPFSGSDLRILESVITNYEYRVLLSPTITPDPGVLSEIAKSSDRESLERYTSRFPFDVTPPTDDRPFFFNQVPLNKPVQALKIASQRVGRGAGLGGIRDGNLVATATLLILFVVALVLVLATIVVPLRPAIKDVGRRLTVGGTLYFLFIGIGFMMVEIALLAEDERFSRAPYLLAERAVVHPNSGHWCWQSPIREGATQEPSSTCHMGHTHRCLCHGFTALVCKRVYVLRWLYIADQNHIVRSYHGTRWGF